MIHLKRNSPLRQWYGPIAKQLLNIESYNCKLNLTTGGTKTIQIDKQSAQWFLIEASFYHQKCMQQFHIVNDLKIKSLEPTHELSELLLYIRMTIHHPSQDNLHIFTDSHIPFSCDVERAIKSLMATKLIQKIEFLHFKFYDKNPNPHDHIFNQKKSDFN